MRHVQTLKLQALFSKFGLLKAGTTKKKIRNEHARGSVKLAAETKKITEKRLQWYGWTCQENGRRARAKKNGRGANTRKETVLS